LGYLKGDVFTVAIFHTDLRTVSRGKGQSLVQKVVYIGGVKLYDAYFGVTRYNPRTCDDVVERYLILPPSAPPEYSDLQILVTALDRAEKRRDAQTAKELEFSLPVELSHNEQKAFARWCVEKYWVSLGMCAYVCLHDKGDGNPHVHAILTTREVDGSGFLKEKNRNWNKKIVLFQWRKFLADTINHVLERKGFNERVSHLSYAAQGIDKIPTKYLGPKASALERDGFATNQGDHNREVLAERQAKRDLEAQKARNGRLHRGRT
jgi:hypothetical protein